MQTTSFQTIDGLRIHANIWLPETPPKAVILLVHGVGEHSGRYPHVAEAFNRAGYAVYAFDHRGHGKSEGLRDYFESFAHPAGDVATYYHTIRERHPDTPIFVYGHSMGALISQIFLLEHQDEINGWVATGSPLTIDQKQPPFVLQAGSVLRNIIPKVRVMPLGAKGVSRDEKIVEDYEQDELNSNKLLRVRMAVDIALAARDLRAKLPQITLPLLAMHGEADPIAPAQGSHILYEKAASTDKTLKVYPGLYHEIHNEPEQETVFRDIVDWLDERL